MHPEKYSLPLPGAHPGEHGTSFALESHVAERVELLLVRPDGTLQSAHELRRLEGPLWHVHVPDAAAGQLYGYRVHGPFQPESGPRCNPHKVLLDPYALAVGRPLSWSAGSGPDPLGGGVTAPDMRDTLATAPLGIVEDSGFDWQGVEKPQVDPRDRIIYETHVRGMTITHPDVPEHLRGTYLGLAHGSVIRHLKELGVTTVQLLPVHAYVQDERLVRQGLKQYWGYNSLSFMAPEPRYATSPQNATHEFRTMVRELHRAGLEVIIDVVYNHTGEGNEHGPTLNLRGIDNAGYYRLDGAGYRDFTGTGNTVDLSRPLALKLVLASMRHWVQNMGVDGFRFDLCATLGRDRQADFDRESAFFQAVGQDPVLHGVQLWAEPWDPGPGGYQMGNFPWQFGEHNGPYRDTVRAVWNGRPGTHDVLATRLTGSSDLFRVSGRGPLKSLNYVTVHDGFTLTDLVSYSRKHNRANLEGNRDGSDHNQSQNAGVEGPTDDPAVLDLRDRLRRGMLATLFVSRGTPLLLGGDELGRTQQGNNNAYCQDNELSWFSWELDARSQEFLRYVQELSRLRRTRPQLRQARWLNGTGGAGSERDVIWYGPDGTEMTDTAWQADDDVTLQIRLAALPGHPALLVIVHAHREHSFVLPSGDWRFVFGSAEAPAGELSGGARVTHAGAAVSILEQVQRT